MGFSIPYQNNSILIELENNGRTSIEETTFSPIAELAALTRFQIIPAPPSCGKHTLQMGRCLPGSGPAQVLKSI
jgi:hypothetical protein